MTTDNGFTAAPERYTGEGRETCDRMRDFLGDEGFAAACASNVIKYVDRSGRKGDAIGDMEKAWWWCRMYLHVCGEADDPRVGRPGFVGYSRPVRRNCWTCSRKFEVYYGQSACRSIEYRNPDVISVWNWIKSVTFIGGMPKRDADGCPGWAQKKAP